MAQELHYNISSWEPEERYHYSRMYRWEPEGRSRFTESMSLAPFWFSTEHRWTTLTPFWYSFDDALSAAPSGNHKRNHFDQDLTSRTIIIYYLIIIPIRKVDLSDLIFLFLTSLLISNSFLGVKTLCRLALDIFGNVNNINLVHGGSYSLMYVSSLIWGLLNF